MQPELCSGSVGIRPFQLADVLPLFVAVEESFAELSTSMTWCQETYSLEKCAAFVSACHPNWTKGEEYAFVIFDPKDQQFLGSVGINHINRTHGFANLGYWVRSSQTKRGVASAAVQLISRFGLVDLGFNRLEMIVSAANGPSRRVAEKAGARFEGILRQRVALQGKHHDAALYSLIREDLEATP